MYHVLKELFLLDMAKFKDIENRDLKNPFKCSNMDKIKTIVSDHFLFLPPSPEITILRTGFINLAV